MTRRLLSLLAAPAVLLTLAGCDDETTRPSYVIRHFVQAERVDQVCGGSACTITISGTVLEQEGAGPVVGSQVWTRVATNGSTTYTDGSMTQSGADGAFQVSYAYDASVEPVNVKVCAGEEVREDDDLCPVFTAD